MNRNKDLLRIVRFAILKYPYNVLPEKIRKLVEEEWDEVKKLFTIEELEIVEEFLKKKSDVQLPDIEGHAFSHYRIYNDYARKIYEEIYERLEGDPNMKFKLSQILGGNIKPKLSKSNPSLMWKVLTLEYDKVKALTPLILLSIAVFLAEKGIVGKVMKELGEYWKDKWIEYGKYLSPNFEEFYKEIKPLLEEAFSKRFSRKTNP